ncbi:beta-glucosidase family protein [Gracilibacillus halotolerans]|nr:glycoside hydrolase family 3 C-terminal domain-containing protein [Gracilibacillus halotolerans]
MLKHQDIINEMTLEEKATLMSGQNFWNTAEISRLNIPSIMLTDGPHGLRKQGGKADHLGLNKSLPATCFPTAATLANSWDKELLYEVGSYLGKEAASENVSVLLGPGLNIKRNPLCGRNFEYFSEDPYLSGKLAAQLVKGIQSKGVAACVKHFAVNSQEHLRMTIDEVVDERALREIYLEGFRIAIEEGKPKTIMTSYNKVNGEYANENTHLLQDILYGEWQYDGVVVTDWGGNNDRVKGLIAGNQLEMPSSGGITDEEIVEAVQSGELEESLLDQRVSELLTLVFETMPPQLSKGEVDLEAHHTKAQEAAKKSMVLLKNEEDILPIGDASVAIIGDFATTPRYQGAGSSLINPTKLDNALEALQELGVNIVGYSQGFKRYGGRSNKLKTEALQLAKHADKVVVFLGLDEGSEAEGIDRNTMELPDNQLELINELAKIHSSIIVVLSGGAVIELPFVSQVKGMVHGYLGGQGSGKAIADILTGKTNPSGKLAETYPLRYEDVPSAPYYPGKEVTAEHRESIFVGYRYFDSANRPVLFPFGHGLSYTKFEYTNLTVDDTRVRCTIKNIGDFGGEEVVQLYIKPEKTNILRANRELKGFTKVYLEPNEEKEVMIELDQHTFQYFDTKEDKWVTEQGVYEIQIGSSIEDIRLTESIELEGKQTSEEELSDRLFNYYHKNIHHISDEEFHHLLGFTPPNPLWDRNKQLGYNDTIAQGKYKKGLGKLLYFITLATKKTLEKLGKPLMANNVMFVMNMPFRQIPRFSNGKVSEKMLDRLLKWINLW